MSAKVFFINMIRHFGFGMKKISEYDLCAGIFYCVCQEFVIVFLCFKVFQIVFKSNIPKVAVSEFIFYIFYSLNDFFMALIRFKKSNVKRDNFGTCGGKLFHNIRHF